MDRERTQKVHINRIKFTNMPNNYFGCAFLFFEINVPEKVRPKPKKHRPTLQYHPCKGRIHQSNGKLSFANDMLFSRWLSRFCS